MRFDISRYRLKCPRVQMASRAQLSRQRRGHGAAHPEGAGLVGAGGDDSAFIRVAADDDGLAPPGRVIQLLDGGEEGVQVHQQDGGTLPGRESGVAVEKIVHADSVAQPSAALEADHLRRRLDWGAVIVRLRGRTAPWCPVPNGRR